MWLSQLTICNFRKASAEHPIVISLKDGLNVIVGENNVGKTTVIEVLTLCLNWSNAERSIWVKESDFHNPSKPIEIILEFAGLDQIQEAAFLEALILGDTRESHILRFAFTFELLRDKVVPRIACGESSTHGTATELLKYLSCIYLPALRDVNLEFRPGARSRIGKILKKRFPRDQGGLETIFNKANEDALEINGEANPIRQLQKQTNLNIRRLSIVGDSNEINLTFVEHEFTRILTNVLMKVKEKGLDISLNGLGYNNLIYISTVLTELSVDRTMEPHTYSCLLIEEPEAHLHPQLQTLLLEFLQTEYASIQVIISSHSPTITSAVQLDNLLLLVKKENQTAAVPVRKALLNRKSKDYLERFLDVTKSQLFFAKKIIFVEGITEAMLLKAFWNALGTEGDVTFDQHGIEIVNIMGVAFDPYVDLASGVFNETDVRIAVVSDDDRGTGADCPDQLKFSQAGRLRTTSELVTLFENSPVSARARHLREKVDSLKVSGVKIESFFSRKSFEVELGIANASHAYVLAGLLQEDSSAFGGLTDIGVGIELWRRITEGSTKAEFAQATLSLFNHPPRSGEGGSSIPLLKPPAHFVSTFEFMSND